MAEKILVDGLIFKRPKDGAPDFVKGRISFKVSEFIAFLQKHDSDGWVNVDLLESSKGTLYTALNTWKPVPQNGEEEVIIEG